LGFFIVFEKLWAVQHVISKIKINKEEVHQKPLKIKRERERERERAREELIEEDLECTHY